MRAISFAKCHLAPAAPGVYLVHGDVDFPTLKWQPEAGPLYVGQAANGLRNRLKKEHDSDTGRSTLRRTLGALLKEELDLSAVPRRGRGEPKPINFTNFSFAEPGDRHLTSWMEHHLAVTWVETSEFQAVEMDLIQEHRPPLNLTGFSNPHSTLIKAARALCAEEARNHFLDHREP